MNKIYARLERWIEEKQLPSAVLQIELRGKTVAKQAFGRATTDTIYDIASLTKVTATLPSLLLLEQAGKLSLQDSISKYIPQFQHKAITIEHCLLHSTGLPGSLSYPQDRYSKKDIWHEIMALPLISAPGSETRYSDVGMVLAGKVVEVVSSQTLKDFAHEYIFKPLNMTSTHFVPSESLYSKIAPTEWDEQSQAYLQGKVHDEVSYRLGGISGSAGLFSTAADLSRYAQMWLFPEHYQLLSSNIINKCITAPIVSRGLGWQVQDFCGPPLACGMNWPTGSYGHTGFTGTSLWIAPQQQLAVVFLTNAVHYGRHINNMAIRNELHDLIFSEFIN